MKKKRWTVLKKLYKIKKGPRPLDIKKTKTKIGHKKNFKVKKASRDFEAKIRDKKTTIEQRKNFARDYLDGMSNLHSAGWVYGDTKPENVLFYEDEKESHIKIGDFGRTSKMEKGDSAKTMSGNLRFAPPECKASQKGDVWGAALVLIRNFEESVLVRPEFPEIEVNPKDRKTTPPKDSDETLKEGRRGIERFILKHKAFPATESLGGFKRVILQMKYLLNLKDTQKTQQQELIHKYIDILVDELGKTNKISTDEANKLGELLKNMTAMNPKKRLSMQEALKEYNEIFPPSTQ